MASIVTEVLTSTGNLAKDDLSEKINKLMKHVDEVKNQVQDTLDSRYITFFPWLSETIDLSSRISSATNEIDTLRKRLETQVKCELQISTSEMQGLSTNLIDVSITLQVVEKMVAMHALLEKINDDLVDKKYLVAAERLQEMQRLLGECAKPCEKQMKIMLALNTEYVIRREKLTYDLGDIWKHKIAWTVSKTSDDVRVRIKCADADVDEMSSLVRAMQLLNYLDTKLRAFAGHAMTNVCVPMMKNSVRINIRGDRFDMKVVVNERATPLDTFDGLRRFFQFLADTAFGVVLADGGSLMAALGRVAGSDFCDLLIENCLTLAIPSNKNDLQDFYRVIEETCRLQEFLVSVGFLRVDQKNILEYARNVDALFANKMCRDVLDKARNLMLLQLHDAVQLEQQQPSAKPSAEPSAEPGDTKPSAGNKLNNVFVFPTCQISRSVQQLMDFAYGILNEACESSPMCAVRLFYTVRNMFELFCAIVPVYHKQNLTILPQVAALHHNNCMYLAHRLITLGHEFSSRLSPSLKDNAVTFVDLVPSLRAAGTVAFQSQVAAQKKQLIEIVRGLGCLHNDACAPLERALKQCLYQLEHLQRVWQPVLPRAVYQQTTGVLVDALLDELIGQIVRQEDIPSSCTAQLISAFGVVIHRTPNLFQPLSSDDFDFDYGCNDDDKKRKNWNSVVAADVCRCVPKWMKFKELLLMLAASMNDILERWAEGKGPLAHEFTANETKQVIRALFQNTDRRSAVLARIK